MSILTRTTADVQPIEWHTDEPTPLDVMIAPAEDTVTTFPGDAETIADLINGSDLEAPRFDRYVVEPRFLRLLNQDGYVVKDRSLDGLVVWFSVDRKACEDHCTDLNAEDWPDLGEWWKTQAPSEHFDRPVRTVTL
ncbi:hypothetical protein [Tautonia rosea]|uniref:hypothetical protein n=1 Tax=Tautonia rosea TaxID=2728037 RepID=UPI0014730AC8|nr:hypothetical protein [Tautonia rosea]